MLGEKNIQVRSLTSVMPILESVRIGWNRQSLGPRRPHPERIRISFRDDAKDEFTGTPVSPLSLPFAIPVPWYFHVMLLKSLML
jgi:hypothetical protein